MVARPLPLKVARMKRTPGSTTMKWSNPIKDLGVFYATSRNILEDEPMMENILQVRVGERMSRRLDNAFLNQVTGANNFTGILQITGFPTFSKDVGDSLQVAITRAIEGINGPAVTGITGTRRTGDGGRHLRYRAGLLGFHAPAGCPRKLHGEHGSQGGPAVAGGRNPGYAVPGAASREHF